MKKLLLLVLCGAALASCSTVKHAMVPRTINTVNTAPLADLNLERDDYEILNTITAEGVVYYTYNEYNADIEIVEKDGEFSMKFVTVKDGTACKHRGILRLGYLSNDDQGTTTDITRPEEVVRRLAIYRLINVAREYGADALVEPTISTNVEQTGSHTITYMSTVTAKILKLKTDR